MGVYQKIQKSFWTDSKVDDDFTPEQKYLYLYLLTNPHTNMAGCYEISTKQMSRETGLAISTVEMNLAELQNRLKVIHYDLNTKELLLLNWWKYNWGASPKVRTCVASDIRLIKNTTYKSYLEKISNSETSVPLLSDTVLIQYPNSMDTSCGGRECDSACDGDVLGEEQKKTDLVYPTKAEFMKLCQENKIAEDFANSIYERYAANGWHDNKGQPIRVWQNVILNAWRKQKAKPAAAAQGNRNHSQSHTNADCKEYPPGSGNYVSLEEWERLQRG